jgi:hypothetical protein
MSRAQFVWLSSLAACQAVDQGGVAADPTQDPADEPSGTEDTWTVGGGAISTCGPVEVTTHDVAELPEGTNWSTLTGLAGSRSAVGELYSSTEVAVDASVAMGGTVRHRVAENLIEAGGCVDMWEGAVTVTISIGDFATSTTTWLPVDAEVPVQLGAGFDADLWPAAYGLPSGAATPAGHELALELTWGGAGELSGRIRVESANTSPSGEEAWLDVLTF